MLEGYFNNLYKYTTYETGLEIIKKQTLRFSKPILFNDPLDCYDGLIEIDESDFPNLVRRKFPRATKQEHLKILNQVKQNFKNTKDNIMNLFKVERDRVLISCFSKSSEKLLMWSYYTNAHKGICFEFFVDHQVRFTSFGEVLPLEVKYKSLQEKIKDSAENYLVEWVTTKSEKWKDEEEVRWILMNVNNKNKYVDIQFPKWFLKKIIFGFNMSDDQRDNVISLVTQNFPNQNIEFSEITIDDTKMDIKEIPIFQIK